MRSGTRRPNQSARTPAHEQKEIGHGQAEKRDHCQASAVPVLRRIRPLELLQERREDHRVLPLPGLSRIREEITERKPDMGNRYRDASTADLHTQASRDRKWAADRNHPDRDRVVARLSATESELAGRTQAVLDALGRSS